MDERKLRILAIIGAWGGWLGSMGIGIWSEVAYDPNHGHFAPQWVGLAFIFLVGVAIAATGARSRHRLSDNIVDAFRIGLRNGQNDESPKHPRSAEDSRNSPGG